MNEDTHLSKGRALAVSRMIDDHDQATTSRARRLELQTALRDIFDAPTTDTLRRARQVRKWCVALGIYVRPAPQHKQPSYLFRPNRPTTKWPTRTHT